ncbi:hypothetical protein [Thermus filiformis]|uniref:Uncharacterized protein n=1 Tax=Thermus filiformis TaxID=276 RepID=A0A0A2WUN1_THEFI|nr:hypothetical protein [Thermus filiformis]KGQ22020.1 hypothetical protein THFILI_05475 [Thermus filiformis]
MKRALILVLFGVLGWVWAASLAEVYDRVDRALSGVRLGPGAGAALDQAQSALRQGADLLPPVLRDALLTNLQEARQAVAQKSQVDLEARLLLIRHLLGKALYDAFFEAKAKGSPEAEALLERLGRAVGLPPSRVEEARKEKDLNALRTSLERWFTNEVALDLNRALGAGSRPEAFLRVTRAYARFLVVQDSPRSTLKARDFVNVLTLISTGQPFRPEVQGLIAKVTAWRKALQATPAQAQAAPQAQTPSAPATPPPAQSQPSQTAQGEGSAGSGTRQPPAPPPQAPTPSLPSPVQAAPGPESAETFYTPSWMDPATAQAVRQKAKDLGYAYNFELLGALEDVREEVGLAVAALGQGNAREGRAHLDRAFWTFRTRVEPVFAEIHPRLTERISRSLTHLPQAAGIRTQDALTLYEALEALRTSFFQGPRESFWLNLKLGLLSLVGIPRAVFFLLAAALALFPLYLVRLTFGGRNLYWNLVALAFLFLLLPAIVEGLSYLGSILADYGGLPALGALANLSIAQGLFPYLAWGVSVFLVVGFATAGLRGIAAQFGLLQGREAVEATQEKPSPTLTSETIVEWDEEF